MAAIPHTLCTHFTAQVYTIFLGQLIQRMRQKEKRILLALPAIDLMHQNPNTFHFITFWQQQSRNAAHKSTTRFAFDKIYEKFQSNLMK